ncbi:MAG: ribosome maturation factor RimP [Ideonella sp.]|nr:ribosome maturation factor RimP [Ideonella sp.]
MSWQAVIERTVSALGYELVDCERSAGGLLRVFIDRVPGDPRGEFIVVEDCEAVTRQLQHVLEVENCAYERLEVSSPGLDRPLKRAADYARFAGQQVNLTLKLPFRGRKKYRGTLVAPGGAACQEGWRLLLDAGPAEAPGGEPQQALDFGLDEVREARLVPVLDFKGRRFLPAAPEGKADAGVDGGLEQ